MRGKGGGEPAFDSDSLDGRQLDKNPGHVLDAQLELAAAAFRNGAMNVRKHAPSTTFDVGSSYQFRRNLALKFALLNLTDKKVPVKDRTRATSLAGNWMVDEGWRVWLELQASF